MWKSTLSTIDKKKKKHKQFEEKKFESLSYWISISDDRYDVLFIFCKQKHIDKVEVHLKVEKVMCEPLHVYTLFVYIHSIIVVFSIYRIIGYSLNKIH